MRWPPLQRWVVAILLLATCPVPPVQGAAADPPPCAECITLAVDPGQSLVLAPPLNGLPIAVRTREATGSDALAAFAAIQKREGVPALIVDVSEDTGSGAPSIDDLAFRLKTRLTEIRGSMPGVELILVGTTDQLAGLRTRDLSSYVDAEAERLGANAPRPSWPRAGYPYARVVASSAAGGAPPARVPPRYLWSAPSDAVEAYVLAADLAQARSLLVADLVPVDTPSVTCEGRRAGTYLNPRTMETVALAPRCAGGKIHVDPPSRMESVELPGGDVIVRTAAPEGQFADEVRVTGARQLTVEEIIARHQAAAARQRTLLQTLISSGSSTLTFEAPGFPAPMAISSETVIYQGLGTTDVEQRSIRVNGIAFEGRGVPRLPIIEPERVASPPLAITLSDVYRYSLSGTEVIDGTPCYVVAFEPMDTRRALFRGRAWIAADTFGMRRAAAVQTGLRGPIVSSEQIDDFVRHDPVLWLLGRSEVRQIYEGAAHRTPIHRVLQITSHEVNPPDFSERRRAAYTSAAVMLRDTGSGFRYLQRAPASDPSRPVQVVLSGPASRVRTVAVGVIVDPNITRPLPFAGLSYLDFDLFGTGTQLNAFFGGTYGQLAFSVPSVRGSRWQLAGRAFGIASSYNDRAFVDGREVYERNIRQRPAHAAVWALRPVSAKLTLRAGYELDYTHFARSDATNPAFAEPADQVAHALRLALEGQHKGWTMSAWWTGTRRAGWRAWGDGASDYDPRHADFQRYGATAARPFVMGPSLVGRIEAAWMSGHDLDRFSRYAFGTFDNRLRGYPSALIRYDRGGVVRTAAAWAAAPRLRVDGFLDTAYVHDPGFGPDMKPYAGVGAALEAPSPFGMLVAVEWGYGFQGVKSGGGRGTQVVRISAFKMF